MLIYQYYNMEKEAKNTSILTYCHIEVFHYYIIQVLSYSECFWVNETIIILLAAKNQLPIANSMIVY